MPTSFDFNLLQIKINFLGGNHNIKTAGEDMHPLRQKIYDRPCRCILRNWGVHNLFSRPNIITVMKWRRVRKVGQLARVLLKENAHKVWSKNLKERDRWEET